MGGLCKTVTRYSIVTFMDNYNNLEIEKVSTLFYLSLGTFSHT